VIIPGEPALVLAPMDGVTDHLMRGFLTARMPINYCVSEFIRVAHLVPPRHIFISDVPELLNGSKTASGTGVGVQLLGGDPDLLAKAAVVAVECGAQVIDLNFGCPAPTVNRHDGGATLLRYPDRIKDIVAAVRGAVPNDIPVSAKLRLGWDDPRAIYLNAEMAVAGGASWITIHGRTKEQGYTPPAYWKPIGEVRRSVGVPVVANGEIWSLSELKRCQEESGCEHFMLGRGLLANPTLAAECASFLGIKLKVSIGPQLLTGATLWRELLGELVLESRSAKESDRRTLARVKQWLNYAHKRGSISWFDSIKRARDSAELKTILGLIGDSLVYS
jgi:tRNA-dihydrouridine synthase C